MIRRLILLFTGLLLVLAAVALPAGAVSTNEAVAESDFLRLINERRAEFSLAPLGSYWDLVDDARDHSRYQSEGNCPDGERICHNPALGSVTTNWFALGENVGVGYDVDGLDRAFWESAAHQANVVGNYNYAGVGVVIQDGGTMYVTVVFMRGPEGLSPTPPAAGDVAGHEFPAGADRVGVHDPGRGTWSLDGEGADFYYGVPSDRPVACDWDGDGDSTVGLYRASTGYLYLRNVNEFGVADIAIFYGIPEDVPLCGDWDGDGIESIGIFRPSESTFYLRNSNSLGFADVEFRFGRSGDVPLAGDWFGSDHDSIGVFRPSTGMLYLADGKNGLGNVMALPRTDLVPADQLVVGDWDADGTDTLGFVRPGSGTFRLLLDHQPDAETVLIPFRTAGRTPVAGVW
ncbi:MAG: CAP domain-containing protein [Acidimicrobiia bacterium]|nr:CAP domain-containing protein [Acidimicrobiia bacterium]